MIYQWLIAAYSLIVVGASLYFDKHDTLYLLVIALLYIASHFLTKNNAATRAVQLILLAAFQWFSGLDWVLALYAAQLALHFPHTYTWRQAWLTSLVYFTPFAIINYVQDSLSVMETYSLFFLTVSFFTMSMILYHYISKIREQASRLHREKERLTTHDALTGLVNFEECHRQLEALVHGDRKIVLILLDCKDLKSLNTTTGFQGVNKLLKEAAQLLTSIFPEALLISRYGGDEFAIVLEAEKEQETIDHISEQLSSEFPKRTGIQLTYGMAVYPNAALSKDDLLLAAEKNLFSMKREVWLKQEEHLFRSEKLRVVGELASGMAHEIRNPLTTVKGFLQISKANDYNIEKWYDLIMNEIDRMSLLTGEFLQFSKPHPKQFKVVPLQDCIHRARSLTESEAIRLGHEMQCTYPEQSVYVWMDPDKMIQLHLNIIKNAFEAMPESGSVRIELKQLGERAVLEISDSGIGMTEAQLEQIFLPFYTTKDSGTGLGLPICQKIVQDHRGILEVKSEKHRGTTFVISLPLAFPERV